MTDDSPDRDDDRDAEDEPQPTGGRRGGITGLIRQLLETVQRMDSEGTRVERGFGRRQTDRADIEYDYAIGIGPARPEGDEAVEDHPVNVREVDGGAIATIDLPDVDPDALGAGVSDRRLTVASDGTRLVTVSLPRSGLSVLDATYNNGVLEIRLVDELEEGEVEFYER